jgi:hypothetical protein
MLTINVSELLRNLDPQAVFSIINTARPASSYLFAKYLPERNETSFHVDSGNLRIIPTMAGLAGMDSPYPEGGFIKATDFREECAKLAIQVALDEVTKRKMYDMMLRMGQGAKSTEYFVNTLLNFSDKILAQAQLDRREWLRGQALANHALSWTFNNKTLTVDYGIDSTFRLTHRTGNDGYGGSSSKFWTDITQAKKKLKHRVAAFIAHPDTIQMIMDNSANNTRVVSMDEQSGDVELVRIVGTNESNDTDARYRVKLIAYGLEGTVYDPTNPEATSDVSFMPHTATIGKIIAIGRGGARGFNIGADAVDEGSTPDEVKPLGYHHIAPTDEGGYAMGDWGRIYTPENEPNKVIGQSVSNNLPVIEATDQVVVLSTVLV